MRRGFILSLLLALVVSTAHASWFTQGNLTAPTSGTVLADIGARNPGVCLQVQVVVSSSANLMSVGTPVTFELQHRNAANNGNIKSQTLDVQSGTHGSVPITVSNVCLDDNERVRVVINNTVAAGNVQASIWTGE